MGLVNFLVQRAMRKEEKRAAKEASKLYTETKANNPHASEETTIKEMLFDEDPEVAMAELPQETRNVVNTFCKTVNGLCYALIIDMGCLQGWSNFRCLQFTT